MALGISIGQFCVSELSNFQPVYSLYHVMLKKCGVISKFMQIQNSNLCECEGCKYLPLHVNIGCFD